MAPQTETPTQYPATTMTPETAPDCPDEGFALVQGLVYDQVYRFHAQHGGDLADLKSDAGWLFVSAHQQYKSGKKANGEPITCSYATKVRQWVWYGLFDAMRNRINRERIRPTDSMYRADGSVVEVPSPERPVFDPVEFSQELSDDARYAMDLALNPPKDLEAVVAGKGGEPRNVRSSVREWLLAHGWPKARVVDAFAEIKKALG